MFLVFHFISCISFHISFLRNFWLSYHKKIIVARVLSWVSSLFQVDGRHQVQERDKDLLRLPSQSPPAEVSALHTRRPRWGHLRPLRICERRGVGREGGHGWGWAHVSFSIYLFFKQRFPYLFNNKLQSLINGIRLASVKTKTETITFTSHIIQVDDVRVLSGCRDITVTLRF